MKASLRPEQRFRRAITTKPAEPEIHQKNATGYFAHDVISLDIAVAATQRDAPHS
jgi:hypothetical protein